MGANDGPIEGAIGGPNVALANGRGLIVDQNLSVPAGTSLSAIASDVRANGLVNNGLVNVNDMALTTTAGLTNNADLVLINTTVEGPVDNAVGSTVTVLGTVDFNGLVSGPGNFFGPGTAAFHGGMAPGASPAAVTFEGNVALSDTNILFVEIGGTMLGSDYDSLSIAGDAALGGILDVTLIDNFMPAAGQQFTVLTADSLLGVFDNAASGQRVTTSEGGGSFLVHYGAGSTFDPTQIVLSDFEVAVLAGDMDCDGDVDFDDIDDFVLGLTDPVAYENQFSVPPSHKGDTVEDGDQDFDDIGRFVAILAAPLNGSAEAVPEPTTCGLLLVGLGLLGSVRHRLKNSITAEQTSSSCCGKQPI